VDVAADTRAVCAHADRRCPVGRQRA
jgi:hypothetical protein